MASHLQILQSFIKTYPSLSTTAATSIILALIAYRDYHAYVSLGPHGLPNTFWGWYKQLSWAVAGKARKDVTSPAPYDLSAIAGLHDRTSFLQTNATKGLDQRPGRKAPTVPGFVAPQRQTSDVATEDMKKIMFQYLDTIVIRNPTMLQTHLSVLEGPVPALGIKHFMILKDRPTVCTQTKGEMCHIHPLDGSTHLILSLMDQRRVIELGWGRRHRLSGSILPWNYTFLYAPRNEMEFEAWKKILHAAARFCCADLGTVNT